MTYADIALSPRYFEGNSRSELDTEIDFLDYKFKLPVVPANMSSVVDEDVCRSLANNGYFYIMHRFFKTRQDWINFVKVANQEDWPVISVSVGVNSEDVANIRDIIDEGYRVDFVTIDIAHGHCSAMKKMIHFISSVMPDVKIIAGNVCTSEAALDLYEWGADCVKVGIAQGGACSTFGKTGFGLGMPETLSSMADVVDFQIIADGGVRTNGDIAKAMVLGCSRSVDKPVMVMAGSLFAACVDSPAVSNERGEKLYYGSASELQKGNSKNVEGFEKWIPSNNMTYFQKLNEIKQDLQSSISYAGGSDLSAFKKVQYLQ
jgi:GMP reductase